MFSQKTIVSTEIISIEMYVFIFSLLIIVEIGYSQLSRLSSKYYYIRKRVDKIGTLILISSVIASAFIASLVRYL